MTDDTDNFIGAVDMEGRKVTAVEAACLFFVGIGIGIVITAMHFLIRYIRIEEQDWLLGAFAINTLIGFGIIIAAIFVRWRHINYVDPILLKVPDKKGAR